MLVNVKDKLTKASEYLNKAILEVKEIPCDCTEDDYCWRCCLLDDLICQKHDINKSIK